MKKYLLIVTLFAVSSMAAISQATDNKAQRLINVMGSAEMEIVPDEIYVHITVREYTRKGGSKTDIENIRNQFIKAALSVGIPDSYISVESYTGWDGNYWWWRKNSKKNPELLAGVTYEVKLPSTKKMDELVAKLDDEATERFNIARVSHSNIATFRKQLKMQAVKAAREKAEYLAAAVGDKVGQAMVINEPNEVGNYPRPMYANTMMKASAMEMADAPEANINFKKMKLHYEAHVTFSLQ